MSLKPVSQRRDDALARTDWAEVERLLAKHYGDAGFVVDHCGTGSGASRYDGGIDLKLRRGEQYVIVQCKHWNAMKVPHNDVHQLIGLMVNEGATGATLVTSGEFTKAAIEAASRHGHVQLVDGDDLRAMLGPLPEPKAVSPSLEDLRHSALAQGAKAAARHVGERLLDAAEERIRGRKRGSRALRVSARVFILKAVLGLVVPVVVAILFMGMVKNILQPAASVATPANSAPMQSRSPVRQAPAAPAAIEFVEQDPVPYASPQPTPEEIREQQRKAEEAIKVLEATTPELYQGRPGQVRGQ